jgi:hypothetical protein
MSSLVTPGTLSREPVTQGVIQAFR